MYEEILSLAWEYYYVIILVVLIILKVVFEGPTCKEKKDLTGKVVVITGGNKNIGKYTALGLAEMGATIVIGARDKKSSEKTIKEIQKKTNNNNLYFVPLDLNSFSSVRDFASNFKSMFNKLDILILNAGIIGSFSRKVTEDKVEQAMQVNHFSHFLLTNLLKEQLMSSSPSRVITLSSDNHLGSRINFEDLNSEKSYMGLGVYQKSKLANVLFAKELHNKFKDRGILSLCVHPGTVRTNLNDVMKENRFVAILWWLISPIFLLISRSAKQGAQTTIYCAVKEGLEGGKYYCNCKVKKTFSCANYPEDATQLWRVSESIVGLK